MTLLRQGNKPLTTDERRLVLRFGAIIAIPLAFIVLFSVTVGFVLYRNAANQRIADNKATIKRVSDLTFHFNNVQRWTEFDNCVADEKQDAVIVSILRTVPPSERSPQIQSGIDALEPSFGDRVCTPPAGPRPAEVRP